MKKHSSHTFLRALVLYVLTSLFLLPGTSAQFTVSVYPDNSPGIDDFRQMGIERVDTIWSADNYRAAFDLLDEIYGVDKMSMPRRGSDYSGALYARLLSYENFAFLTDPDEDLGRRLLAYERGKDIPARILLYYRETNQPEEGFDAEVLDALLLAFYVESQGLDLHDELLRSLPPQAASHPRMIEAVERMQFRYRRSLENIMRVFLEDLNRYSETALIRFANEVYFLLPARLTDAVRPDISAQLTEAVSLVSSEELRTVLLELRGQL